jgi:hypothetical protein
MKVTIDQINKMKEDELRKYLFEFVNAQDEFERLVTDFELKVQGDKKDISIVGYEWVIKCPYRMCGSSDIKSIKSMVGAIVYHCNQCNHLFKVLQEGDVYFFDVGKEEWANAEFSIRPSYFVATIDSKEYRFDSEKELNERIKVMKGDVIKVYVKKG